MRKQLDMGFTDAVAHVEKIIVEEGFSHILSKSVSDIFKKKLGIDYPGYTMILACGPEMAKMALDASIDVGTLFPCSFVVYEKEGKVYASHTSIMRAAVEIGLASQESMEDVIKLTSERVHKAWNRL